jgi:hypothetical protein
MIGMYAIVVVFALIAGGAALGIVIVISLGIRREEKHGTLTVDSPGRIPGGARTIMAVSSRRPGVAYQVRTQREEDLAA